MVFTAKIVIDTKKCIEVAENARALGGIPKDREDPMPHTFPRRIAHNGWCAAVAINQQTTPVVGSPFRGTVKGMKLRGWDCLLQKMIAESNRVPDMCTVDWLCAVTSETVREMFHDDEEGDTLNQIDTRAMLLADLGNFLKRNRWESIHEMYLESEGFILRSDGRGIAQMMNGAKAYQDPVQKKLFYFLAIMKNNGFWEYQDMIYLSSPVNYHEQRGHLRLGTVKILDAELERKIRARENITDQEDIEIRFAVRKAIEFMAQLLDVTPSMMHYYFWNHFRNCCSRENPHCLSCGDACKLPERYRRSGERFCIFSSVCQSSEISVKTMFIEPRLDNTIWQ